MWKPKLNKEAAFVGLLFLAFYPLGAAFDNWFISKGISPYIGTAGNPVSAGILADLTLALTAYVIIRKRARRKKDDNDE